MSAYKNCPGGNSKVSIGSETLFASWFPNTIVVHWTIDCVAVQMPSLLESVRSCEASWFVSSVLGLQLWKSRDLFSKYLICTAEANTCPYLGRRA